MADAKNLTEGDLNKKLEKICEDIQKLKKRKKEVESSDAVVHLVEKQNLLRRIRNERRNLEKDLSAYSVEKVNRQYTAEEEDDSEEDDWEDDRQREQREAAEAEAQT